MKRTITYVLAYDLGSGDHISSYPVKIGKTTIDTSFDPKTSSKKLASSRIKAMQTGSPYPLNCIRTYIQYGSGNRDTLEKYLHAKLDSYKVRGEWFDIGDPLETYTKIWHAIEEYSKETKFLVVPTQSYKSEVDGFQLSYQEVAQKLYVAQ